MADFLWVEKYRPKQISECILPEDIKTTFQNFLKQGQISHLLLSGTAGTGKTTVARALCEELKCDYLIINGSDEGRQIDTLRTKIKNFASTVSLTEDSPHKVIILDEDYMNADSVQPALRNFMKSFIRIVDLFLLVISEIKSYLLCNQGYVIDFKVLMSEKKCADQLLTRLTSVLNDEKIPFDKKYCQN